MMRILFAALAILLYSVSPASAQRLEAGTSTALWGKAYTVNDLKEASAADVDYIEVAINQSYRGVPAEKVMANMKKNAGIIDSTDVSVWSVHLPFSRTLDISVLNDSLRQKNVSFIADIMRSSAILYKPERFVLHPSSEPIESDERESRIQCAISSIRELKKVSDETGIMLCIENLPRTCLGNTPEELVRITDSVPGVYICFDTNHYVKGETDDFIRIAGQKIKTVHISDYDMVNECHWLPYDGKINWPEFLYNLIITAKYDGVLMYEVKKRSDGSKVPVTDIGESLERIYNEYENLK